MKRSLIKKRISNVEFRITNLEVLKSKSIIISKRWNFFSLHLSPGYMYQYLKVSANYKESRKSDATMIKHNSDEETFKFHPFGVTVGFSLLFKHLQLTPEVLYLHVKDLPNDAYRWILYPGLGLYVKCNYSVILQIKKVWRLKDITINRRESRRCNEKKLKNHFAIYKFNPPELPYFFAKNFKISKKNLRLLRLNFINLNSYCEVLISEK